MKRNLFIEIISFLFILLFVYAAASKMMDYEKFRLQLGQSPLLTAFAGWIAWFIPLVEIGISIMLAIPKLRFAGLCAGFSLMVSFTAYVIAITKFSSYVPCSCGGVLQNMTWSQHLVFNIAFVILGIAGIVFYRASDQRQEPGQTNQIVLLQ